MKLTKDPKLQHRDDSSRCNCVSYIVFQKLALFRSGPLSRSAHPQRVSCSVEKGWAIERGIQLHFPHDHGRFFGGRGSASRPQREKGLGRVCFRALHLTAILSSYTASVPMLGCGIAPRHYEPRLQALWPYVTEQRLLGGVRPQVHNHKPQTQNAGVNHGPHGARRLYTQANKKALTASCVRWHESRATSSS